MSSSASSFQIHALRAIVIATTAALAACGGGSGDVGANDAAGSSGGGSTEAPSPGAFAAPSIVAQPAAASVIDGGEVSFTVVAAGTGGLRYQWMLNGVEIAGATAASYTLSAVTVAQSGGAYTVKVSNAGGSVTSQAASLTVTARASTLSPKAQRLSGSPSGYMLATRADGSVVAWGTGMVGGTGTAVAGTALRVVSGVSGAAAVSGSAERSLVVSNIGVLYGWGRNAEGALGVQVSGYNQLVSEAVAITQISAVAQALSCDRATYVLKTDGTVWLVPGQRDAEGKVVATRVADLSGIQSLVVANETSTTCDLLALDASGRGWTTSASQGDWDPVTQRYTWNARVTQNLVVPPQTKLLACDVAVIDNWGHCLAQTSDGKLWAWGQNHAGQLGLGDTLNRTIATEMAAIANVKALLSGGNYSYVLTTDGSVYGWGGTGQDGPDVMLAGTNSTSVPALLPQISGVEELVMPGPFPQYMAAMKSDGSVWVWGFNNNGVFGDGTSGNYSASPVQVRGLQLK